MPCPPHIHRFCTVLAAQLQPGMVASVPLRPGTDEVGWVEVRAVRPSHDFLSLDVVWSPLDFTAEAFAVTYAPGETVKIGE